MRKEKWPKTAVSAVRLPKLIVVTGNRGRGIQRRCHNSSRKLNNNRFWVRAV